MKAESYSFEIKGKNPFIVLDLKKYQAMLEEIEDLKDRLAIYNRLADENVPWEETEKTLTNQFDLK